MPVRIFLSTVSDEFRDYRDQLRDDLTRHNVEVKVQEQFKDLGTVTLDKLDVYITNCDAVVHLVGDMTGATAKPKSTKSILAKYPDLPDKLPPLRQPLADGLAISYTQWEAWLALYHDKLLVIAKADDAAPRGPKYAPTATSRSAQRMHLEWLRAEERYEGCMFTSPDNLAKHILSGAILDLLSRESLGAATIEQIETAVRAKSPKLTATQIDRFTQSLRELKGDPSFARAVEEAKEGNTRVAEGIWLQIYENRKKEQQKAQQERAEAARNLAASAITNSVEQGLKWYREATSLDPDNIEGWLGLGEAALAEGTLAEADVGFLRYIELARHRRNDRQVLVGLTRHGDALMAQGNLPEALKTYRDGLAIIDRLAKADPGNGVLQHNLGVSNERVGDVLMAQGNLAEALKSYRAKQAIISRLTKASPSNDSWQRDRGRAIRRQGFVAPGAFGPALGLRSLQSFGPLLRQEWRVPRPPFQWRHRGQIVGSLKVRMSIRRARQPRRHQSGVNPKDDHHAELRALPAVEMLW
jgi:tetratricopeptide (TPR) repeat protein